MESSQRLPMRNRDNINVYGIVYSPNKYRETEGIKESRRCDDSYATDRERIKEGRTNS